MEVLKGWLVMQVKLDLDGWGQITNLWGWVVMGVISVPCRPFTISVPHFSDCGKNVYPPFSIFLTFGHSGAQS